MALTSTDTAVNAADAWKAALADLELQLTRATFDTWLRRTHVVSCEDGQFVIGVHSGYAKDWLSHRLKGTVQRALARAAGRTVAVEFVVLPEHSTHQSPSLLQGYSEPTAAPAPRAPTCGLNSGFLFSNFVVGSNNRLAHAAALAVANKPAHAYNPLFIHGGVGLGKTHLLQAIGNQCMDRSLRVAYVTSEEFTNDLVNAIRLQTTEAFRAKYRTPDVLLIDDIQFIAGKESTQEEFFHTFNTLHSAGRQIALTSDRPPRAILTLEERLRSRFEGGLIVDIQAPDYETRAAILREKAASQHTSLADDVVDLIARRVQRNIRDLQGALTRVLAYCELTGRPLTWESAAAALQAFSPHQTALSPDHIIRAVAMHYSVAAEDMQGKSRQKDLALARHVAMYLMRENAGLSLPEIGKHFGARDHTTVMHGCEKIRRQIEQDSDLRRDVLAIKEALSENRQGVAEQTL